jgi:hypothetical protein
LPNFNPVTKEQQYLQAILDQQEETNRLLNQIVSVKDPEILEEVNRQQQKGGKKH